MGRRAEGKGAWEQAWEAGVWEQGWEAALEGGLGRVAVPRVVAVRGVPRAQ